jgi:MFS family permease
MRATASAYYLLAVTFIGLALGPYSMGQVSDRFVRSGTAPADALGQGMLISLVAYAIAVVFLVLTSRFVEGEEASRIERAKALGEAVT